MSSPKVGKTAKPAAKAKAAPAKTAAKPVKARKAEPHASVEASALVGEDKVHFVKAMWEGVPPKGAKAKAAKPAKAKAEKAKAEKAPKVEILRKISAPTRVQSRQTPESTQALTLVGALEAKFEAGELDVLTPEATQALVGVICKIYGANQESGNKYPLLSGRAAVTGTDAMIACSALLKAVDLQVFELGMWQSWSGV